MALTALIVGPAAKGQVGVAYPGSSGDVVYNRFQISIPATTVVATVLEIGVLPPNCRVTDMVIETEALGASVTCSVGVIADTRTPYAPPGSNAAADLAARTCGTEFFAATSLTSAGATRMGVTVPTTCWAVAPVSYERGIGVLLAGASTPSSVKVLTLHAWFAAA